MGSGIKKHGTSIKKHGPSTKPHNYVDVLFFHCGEEWLWNISPKALASSIVDECPSCKNKCSIERAEFANL
jgi:hypothetical protein